MNLTVKIGNAEFKNPVTVASGTCDYIKEYFAPQDFKILGAFIPKTVTLDAQEGNPPPRILETPAGMLNAIGLENAGADAFIKNKLPLLKKLRVPLIVSFSGNTDEQFEALTAKFNAADGIAAYELNLSCPNLGKKVLVAQDPQATARVVEKVKRIARVPVIAKLSPNVTDITQIAMAAQDAGADALSLINTFSAMAIDVESRAPILGNMTGGLSGPAIRPIAVYMVYQVARKVKIPLIAMGGIMTDADALEFLIAGATMVAVGTANFISPGAPREILQGIKDYMRQNKMESVQELIGSVKR